MKAPLLLTSLFPAGHVGAYLPTVPHNARQLVHHFEPTSINNKLSPIIGKWKRIDTKLTKRNHGFASFGNKSHHLYSTFLESHTAATDKDRSTDVTSSCVRNTDPSSRSMVTTDEKEETTASTTRRMSIIQEKCQSFLDLNDDGKVDIQDLYVLTQKLEKILDVNGDGKVDVDDAKTALSIIMLSSALLISPSPAFAKGGGGHSSSSRSSSSRSSGYHSSYSHHYDDYHHDSDEYFPPYKRRVGTGKSYKTLEEQLHPMACVALPNKGDVIDMRISPSSHVGKYRPAIVGEVNEGKCQFVATTIKEDKGDTPNLTKTFTTSRSIEYELLVSLPTLYFGQEKMKKILLPFQREEEVKDSNHDSSKYTTSPTAVPPRSGTFKGTSKERDFKKKEIFQKVKTKLRFFKDGKIRGSGRDSIDGSYDVYGSWKENDARRPGNSTTYTLHWREQYDDFYVRINAQMTTRTMKVSVTDYDKSPPTSTESAVSVQTIKGTFESSLGISGTFKIESDD